MKYQNDFKCEAFWRKHGNLNDISLNYFIRRTSKIFHVLKIISEIKGNPLNIKKYFLFNMAATVFPKLKDRMHEKQNRYIYHLPYSITRQIAQNLDVDDAWQHLGLWKIHCYFMF